MDSTDLRIVSERFLNNTEESESSSTRSLMLLQLDCWDYALNNGKQYSLTDWPATAPPALLTSEGRQVACSSLLRLIEEWISQETSAESKSS